MKVGRNEPCPCGSGKKYKFCCELKKAEGKGDWSRYALYAIAISIGLGIGGFFIALADAPDDGRVWSAEHGHWHNADGTEIVNGAGGPPFAQPPGPAPAGKVWSAEHGHWHDADGSEIGAGNIQPAAGGPPYPQPPGPVPAGKVWSPDHGHWHDEVTGMATD